MGQRTERWRLVAAASRGEREACYTLGKAYLEGLEVARDVVQAIHWLERAAAHGSPGAQLELGLLFDAGIGVARSAREALRWWTEAAASGSVHAHYYVGLKLFFGRDVPPDPVEAVARFITGARRGDRMAAQARRTAEQRLTPRERQAARARACRLLGYRPA